ncbi:MAG TPA: imelysin family protein [Polyangiaceae bacterium]
MAIPRGRRSTSSPGWLRLTVTLTVALAAACTREGPKLAPERSAAFLVTYADIALAGYGAALSDARALSTTIDGFVQAPSAERLQAARAAWISARRSYMQTEAYRFYGGPIDSVELLVNTWPVDENYLESEDGRTGIVADATHYPELTPRALSALNLKEGETSVSTGYHAIEFLLWGRDRSASGPGDRSFHDYDTAEHARRRGQYLRAAAGLLVENLASVEAAWKGEYRAAFLARPVDQALALAVKGLGSLSGGELLGERLTVAYETRSQENEHSCFSDNTHEDLRFDAIGIQNVCLGRYAGVVRGVGLSELVRGSSPALASELEQQVAAAVDAVGAIPAPFDQAILGDDRAPGRQAIERAIQALRQAADALAKVASTFNLRLQPAANRAP